MIRLRGSPGDDSKPAFVFALIFFVLASGIVSTGWLYYRNQEKSFRAEVEKQLLAIADLKVSELVQWRAERLGDAGVLFKNATIYDLVRRFLGKPEDADAQRQLQMWFGKYEKHLRYDHVRLLDAQGVTRLSWPAGLPVAASVVIEQASEAFRSGQVLLQDFYRSADDQKVRLALLIPILDERDGSRPLGVLVLRINPEYYLYPFIKRWPMPSPTAETLLLRRDGNDILYLNDLRHQTNAALALRLPLTRTEVPGVRAALGQTGIMTGVDYRGVPVFCAGRAVPDSPWFMVAKIDLTEVNAPIRERLRQIVDMLGILLLGSGAGVGLVWRQQRVRFYRQRAQSAEALNKSQDLLTQAEKLGKVGGWEFDIETKQQTWTETVYEIHELDITNRPTVDQGINFYTPASRPIIERAVQRAIEQGEPFDLELEIITAKGNLRSIHAIGKADLERRKVSGFFQDITERKRAEVKLQASEAKFRTLAENVQVGIVAHAPDTSILLSNPMATEILGLTSDQIRGKKAIDPAWRFIREDGTMLPLAEYPVNRVLAEEMPIVGLVLGVLRPDRELPTWVECNARKIWGPTGELEQAIVVFADITERKKAEQALLQSRRAALNMMTDAVEARDRSEQLSEELKRHRDHLEQLVAGSTADLKKSEEKFRTLADFAYEWEYWIGPDRSIIYMSPSCERITGYPADEYYKNPGFMDTIIHPKDKAAFKEHINTYHIGGRRGEPCEFEFWIIDKGGREKLIAHVCRPVIDADGLYRGRRVSNRDITDRKHAEEELKRQSVQLEAANKELEAFSYSVSHDLKAPLRSVDGFARMLEEDYAERLDDEGRRLLQVIRDSAQDMGQLINDLLEFSRLSRKDLKTGRIGMSELVEDVRRQIEQAETGRAIRWDLGELPPAFGDEASIRVVLINLLANAVKFTRPRREAAIGISGRVEGNDVVYSVTDNGVGFDMAYRDKLFCVFQRLHAATEFEGTGIGLALVQRIVLRHGGKVWAEGKVNEGATFYFALPCRKNEKDEMRKAEKEEETT